MLASTTPSSEPLILAALATFVIIVVLFILNIRAIIRYLSIKETGKRASVLAWLAWILSILSPWFGPLVLIGTPLSLLMGLWAWLRLPADVDTSHEQVTISYKRSVIPARMAVLNGFGVSLQIAVMIAAVYFAFGSLLRDIIWEFWQNKELFRDYIVI